MHVGKIFFTIDIKNFSSSFQNFLRHFCSNPRKVFIRCLNRHMALFMSKIRTCLVNCLWCLKATSCEAKSISPKCSINSSINSIRKCSPSLIASIISTMSKCHIFSWFYSEIFFLSGKKNRIVRLWLKKVVINCLMRNFYQLDKCGVTLKEN